MKKCTKKCKNCKGKACKNYYGVIDKEDKIGCDMYSGVLHSRQILKPLTPCTGNENCIWRVAMGSQRMDAVGAAGVILGVVWFITTMLLGGLI